MIIRPIARNTTAPTNTCAPENTTYCLSTQPESNNNDTSSIASSATPAPRLAHRNLVGVLVIAALLALGLILWLCFGKWSKPIRRFLRGDARRRNGNGNSNNHATARFGIGDGLAAPIDRNCGSASTPSKVPESRAASLDDVEKDGMVNSSSSSSQSSLADREAVETDKDKEMTLTRLDSLEPALPAKVR